MTSIAVFDFDGTIIQGDSVLALVRYAQKCKCISIRDQVRSATFGLLYALRLIPAICAKEAAHRFLFKMDETRRAHFLKCFAKLLTDHAYPDALQQIARHKAQGELVLICSASCHCYMEYVADYLQADGLVCTMLSPNGLAAGENCRGAEKVRRVQQWLDENDHRTAVLTSGYGDSGADAYLLAKCQTPVLVNPKKKLLRRMPQARIVHWHEA